MTQLCATITDARVLDGYRVELTFSDGVRGVVDLTNRIVGRGGVFAPLENPAFFRQVTVDGEFGTIVWPNGADFCPDMLYEWIKNAAAPAELGASNEFWKLISDRRDEHTIDRSALERKLEG